MVVVRRFVDASPTPHGANLARGTGGGATAAKKESPPTEQVEARPRPEVVGGALVGAALCAWLIIAFVEEGPSALSGPVEGISLFALFYVLAQAVERIIELFASIFFTTAGAKKERDGALNSLNAAQTADEEMACRHDAGKAQARIEQRRLERAILASAFATVLGIYASAELNVSLLTAVGVDEKAAPRWGHLVVTGLAIGGGTKPLHDLISRVQAAKDKATDPVEVGGSA
jgi:hypothetical protein